MCEWYYLESYCFQFWWIMYKCMIVYCRHRVLSIYNRLGMIGNNGFTRDMVITCSDTEERHFNSFYYFHLSFFTSALWTHFISITIQEREKCYDSALSKISSDFERCAGKVVAIPHICHGRHGRRPCKFFLAGVNFYRLTRKIGNLLCKFRCKFYFQKCLPV